MTFNHPAHIILSPQIRQNIPKKAPTTSIIASGGCFLLINYSAYQEAFWTPGIWPLCANSRKFKRLIPNLRM